MMSSPGETSQPASVQSAQEPVSRLPPLLMLVGALVIATGLATEGVAFYELLYVRLVLPLGTLYQWIESSTLLVEAVGLLIVGVSWTLRVLARRSRGVGTSRGYSRAGIVILWAGFGFGVAGMLYYSAYSFFLLGGAPYQTLANTGTTAVLLLSLATPVALAGGAVGWYLNERCRDVESVVPPGRTLGTAAAEFTPSNAAPPTQGPPGLLGRP